MASSREQISRRQFLATGVAAALGASGLYGLLESQSSVAAATTLDQNLSLPQVTRNVVRPRLLEQYLLQARTLRFDDVTVVSPPLHHAVVTAKLTGPISAASQSRLETVLEELENEGLLDFTATGGVTIFAWSQSYFSQLPSALTSSFLPVDLTASATAGTTVRALTDAVRFASDPSNLILEANDLAAVFASDSIDNINTSMSTIFNGSIADLFEVTSIRRGFVDASQLAGPGPSLTKQMALNAGIPGAEFIPDTAELFLGFTSTQIRTLAPTNVANMETLPGMTDQFPNRYFARGTTMHLSHIDENLVAWYKKSYPERVGAAFSALRPVPHKHDDTFPPKPPESEDDVHHEMSERGFIGHSSSMQPITRLTRKTTDNYGVHWNPGTAIPLRADFNTVDNPFAYSANPTLDRWSPTPAAGLHFVVFMPTSSMFDRMRKAMDGQYAGHDLGTAAAHGPFNRVLTTTHRQNFLVPPTAHRSFPLAELL